MRVALLSSTTHVGGVCSGGLGKELVGPIRPTHLHVPLTGSGPAGKTDIGRTEVIGGLALEFFKRNGQRYASASPVWNLEPHVAQSVFLDMLTEANVTLYSNAQVQCCSLPFLSLRWPMAPSSPWQDDRMACGFGLAR
jgi:hypothetical protein